MACNSKSLAIILWQVISAKLNIGKKITGFEIMKLNRKKIQHYFQTYTTDVYRGATLFAGMF